MSTLDEITQEKQRVSEALARVDAQREKLASQLGEREATERVLARYSKGAPARRTGSAKTTTAAKATAPAQSRRRPRNTAAKPAARQATSPSLGDQILTLANGKTQQEIAAACNGVRANHVGIAIAAQTSRPHRRARREALCDAIDAANPTLCGITPEQKQRRSCSGDTAYLDGDRATRHALTLIGGRGLCQLDPGHIEAHQASIYLTLLNPMSG